MDLHRSPATVGFWSRVRTLQSTGAVSGSLTLTPAAFRTGCRMILGLFPGRYRDDRTLQDRILRAFVVTVIPGADPAEINLVRMYHDADYPFAPFTGFLVFDLARRGERLFGTQFFENLPPGQQTSVIQDALSSDDILSRLYRGAILMAQVSYFAGIYDPEGGCSLIDFPGKNRGFSLEESSYPFAHSCFGSETTTDGNPR